MSDYQRGYLDGYRDLKHGIGDAEAERQAFTEALGHEDIDADSDYWVGYHHGQYHQQHGEPGKGAIGRAEIPVGL